VSVVTPLGPLGLDWAYGFDRRSYVDRGEPRARHPPRPALAAALPPRQMMF
jgi:hypothetical protein